MTAFSVSLPTPDGAAVISLVGSFAVAAVPPPPPPPPTDLQVAQAFRDALILGVNVERFHWRELTYKGQPIGSSPAYWLYLKSLGVNYVRFFIPFGFSGAGTQLGQADVVAFMQVVKQALAAGLYVLLDLTDVINLNEVGPALNAYLAMAAGVVAAQNFDPARIAIGAVNEPAAGSSADWQPHVIEWHDILRAALPGYVLIAGGANWKYYGKGLNGYDNSAGLTDGAFQPLADMRVLYDIHDYDPQMVNQSADAAATWAVAYRNVSAWQAANQNRPAILGEYGWSDVGGIIAAAIGAGPLRPCAWTVTSGSSGRINSSATDAALPPPVEQALTVAAGYVRSLVAA